MSINKMVYLHLDNDGEYNKYHSLIFDNDGFIRLYTSPVEFQIINQKHFNYKSVRYLSEIDADNHIAYVDDILEDYIKKQ